MELTPLASCYVAIRTATTRYCNVAAMSDSAKLRESKNNRGRVNLQRYILISNSPNDLKSLRIWDTNIL